MKRLLASAALLTIICCYLWSCEKDDICADGTPTTPALIIEFYDTDNREELKSVDNLQIFAVGSSTILNLGTVSKAEVPLKSDTEFVKYGFTWNIPVTNGSVPNTDYITIRYSANQVYVSRACGFRSVFTLNPDTDDAPNPEFSDNKPADNLWIDDYIVETTNIENEDEAHIKIFF